MLIRDAHPDEFAEIGDVRVGAYLADGFLSPDSGYAPRLRELGADGGGPVLVAVDDSAIVGTAMLQTWPNGGEFLRGPDEAEMRALAVRPGSRGRGVGRALVDAVIERAAGLGIGHLLLLTQSEMKTAHRIYEQAGFARLPDRDRCPEPGISLLAYGLDLGCR
jgi:GNAT superfamily N-acetyltransferase